MLTAAPGYCWLQVYGSVNASRVLHADLLGKVLRLPMSFFDSQPTGRLLNRFSRDTELIDIMLITYCERPRRNATLISLSCFRAFLAGPADVALRLFQLGLQYQRHRL